jgi:uncharacterized membrane-anchored protein YitT (DUF2179 family)
MQRARIRNKQLDLIKNMTMMVIGNILFAFGTAFFLVPMKIVNGGMSGMSIIFQELFATPVVVTTTILAWGFFLLGLLLLGKKFTLSTLLATIVYPLALFIFIEFIGVELIGFTLDNDSHKLLASFFGGAFVGVGVALTFLAGGSTGGFDVMTISLHKFFEIKASVTSFIIDALIITVSIFVFNPINALYGIISIIASSLMIELVFVGLSQTYFVTIISEKYDQINQYIIRELERGSTLVAVKGGYSDKAYQMIQVAISRAEYFELKEVVANVDAQAFVVFSQVRSINGLGFNPFPISTKSLLKGKKVNERTV